MMMNELFFMMAWFKLDNMVVIELQEIDQPVTWRNYFFLGVEGGVIGMLFCGLKWNRPMEIIFMLY